LVDDAADGPGASAIASSIEHAVSDVVGGASHGESVPAVDGAGQREENGKRPAEL
jgi:hypothetical protein